jgi:hypothetical protein
MAIKILWQWTDLHGYLLSLPSIPFQPDALVSVEVHGRLSGCRSDLADPGSWWLAALLGYAFCGPLKEPVRFAPGPADLLVRLCCQRLGQGPPISRELPPALVIQLSGLRESIPGDAKKAYPLVALFVDDHLGIRSPLPSPDLLADHFAEDGMIVEKAVPLDPLGPNGNEVGLGEEDAELLLWNAERSERRRLAELEP